MRTRLMLLVFVAFLVTEVGLAGSGGQVAVNIVGQKEVIPDGYKTYSLFLICNPEWLDPSKSRDLTELYKKFQAFGRSIGDDQAAIWFWKTTVREGWENTMAPGAAIDVERSIRFCQAWKLKPSDGPYLVVTSTRPDEANLQKNLPDGKAIFQLGGLTAAEIATVLSKLTDSLLLTGKVDPSLLSKPASDSSPSAGSSAPPSPALWIRMLAAAQQIIGEFGCAVTFKVDAGPLSADVKSCKGPS
jgi:hypothetical protein